MTRAAADSTSSSGRRWRVLATVSCLSVLLGVGIWLVWYSAVLGVREVEVTGNETVSADLVRSRAGIVAHTPLARLDLAAIEQKVETLAQVRRATVIRTWPNTVTIQITERRPVAVVTVAGQAWLIDKDARLYLRVDELPEKKAPPGVVSLVVDNPSQKDPATKAAIEVIQALPAELREVVKSVSAEGPNQVTFVLFDGRKVIWGGSQDNDTKAKLLPALLTRPGKTFDVSSPDAAVVR